MVRHPEPGAGEVDAEPALGTVCEAVAVSRLPVGHQRSLHLPGELEVVGWKYSGAVNTGETWADLRLTEREEMLRLILLQAVTPTRGESSLTQGQDCREPLLGQLSGLISRSPKTSL